VKVAKHRDASVDQSVVEMRKELAGKIADRAVAEGDTLSEISGLRFYRRSVPTACTSATYEPSLVVFVQGQKRINVGKATYLCDGSNFLLTSVDLKPAAWPSVSLHSNSWTHVPGSWIFWTRHRIFHFSAPDPA
jgi:AraC-type transcriptional regulator N-terminus